jgi:DNA polymerase elongation subunit (family B)
METLEIHAYDWAIRDSYGDDDNVAIHCWALDKDSNPCLVRYIDFPAFCHVELPLFVRGKKYNWDRSYNTFVDYLSKRLGDNAPIKHIFKNAKKTYYYRGNRTFPMLLLCFQNLKSLMKCKYLLDNAIKTDDWGFIKCNVWEDSISLVRKLLTVKEVRYSQWHRVEATKVEPESKISTIENEYIGVWDTMKSIPLEECKNWNTQPKILAFDIECYSNNHRAMPDKYNALHVAYMISCIFQKYRDHSSRKRYGVIIGDCNHIPKEKLDDCEIIKVETEYEMIEAFAKIVRDTDPEILTGYNILGFDYPYLDHRVKRRLHEWPEMSRIDGEKAFMTSKTWKSGAYGHQSINILQMEGRISIDLLPIVKRDYKLDKYDLNSVCKKFINKTKHDVKAQDMFLIYEDMRNSLTKLIAISEEAISNPSLLNDSNYVKRKNDAQEEFNKAKDETTRVMEYCIQDSELVIDLMEKMNIWVGLVEMSNIVGTTIVELFTRGQQVRCVSQLYDLASRMGFVLDSRDVPGFRFGGGYVFEPIPGLYENIICLDFSSLYPSIMMAYNICYTTLVPPELENSVSDDECNIIEFDQDETELDEEEEEEILQELGKQKEKKEKIVKKHYKFKFYKNQEGLLPRLVKQLVTERRAVNKQIAQTKDELKANEKTEDIYLFLDGIINGTFQIGNIVELTKKVKELSESKPPAAPEVITKAKKDLMVAQLFDIECTSKKLNEAMEAKPPTHPLLIQLAKLENKVSQLGKDNFMEIYEELKCSQKERLAKIDSHKLLIVVLDKRQLALKVSANSFFGFLGVHTGGKMPLIEGAMSITAKGRELINKVREYIEQKYGGKQIYGDTDSVRSHTPILIRHENGVVEYIQIKDLISLPKSTGEQEYFDLTQTKYEVWTEKGWTKMKYLMRHKTTKKLFRIVTHTGIVDVTEDHSLLNKNGQEITPNEVSVGSSLLHNNLPNEQYYDPDMDEEKAWAFGFFMAEGTCGSYNYNRGMGHSWSVSNQNHVFLDKAQRIFKRCEPNFDFIIDPCMESSNVDKLNAIGNGQSVAPLVEKYNDLFYTDRSEYMKQNAATDLGIRYKKVPYQILMATNNIKAAFLQGWYDGDGSKKEGNSRRFDIKGQIGAAGLFYIVSALGYNVSLNERRDKEETYRLTFTKNKQRKAADVIKKIIPLGTMEEDVFDIETENHHFGAGIGRMIVHNSVMMSLPQIKESKDANYWGVRLAQEISGIKPGEKDCDGKYWPEGRPGLFPPPLAMEFEKAMRLLCLKKKKYAAYLIGNNGKFKTEDIMDKNGNVIGNKLMMLKKGIILARRDNCPYLRDTYTKILETIMNKGNISDAMNILVDSIQELLDGKVPHEKLIIIRELGANYKSENFFMKVFSNELKKAGKIVNPGDRLDFLIVEDPSATLLGHKMKLREQYEDSLKTNNPYKIDYNYYVEKALMNPINQLFDVGFKGDIEKMKDIYFKPTRARKNIYLDQPVKLLHKMLIQGYDIQILKNVVKVKYDSLLQQPKMIRLNIIKPEAVENKIIPQSQEKRVIPLPQEKKSTPSQEKRIILPQQEKKVILLPSQEKKVIKPRIVSPPMSPSLTAPKILGRANNSPKDKT